MYKFIQQHYVYHRCKLAHARFPSITSRIPSHSLLSSSGRHRENSKVIPTYSLFIDIISILIDRYKLFDKYDKFTKTDDLRIKELP